MWEDYKYWRNEVGSTMKNFNAKLNTLFLVALGLHVLFNWVILARVLFWIASVCWAIASFVSVEE